jgi:hypothetical protein
LLRLIRLYRRVPIEAVPAAALAFSALYFDEPWRWIFGFLAWVLALVLFRTTAGIWLFALALAISLAVVAERWKDAGDWGWVLGSLAVASLGGAAVWTLFPRIRRVPVEAVPAVTFGVLLLFIDEPERWLAGIPALLFTVLLFRTDAGIRLFFAAAATGLFAAAVFWEGIGGWRLAFVGAGVFATLAARWLGAVVWPDVAIIFLVGLGVVAVRDARSPDPEVEPVRPPVAVFELPQDRVRRPANELRAPSRIELLAVTPARASRAARIVHDTLRFDAVLLTPVERSGAAAPVRVLVERGEDGAIAKELARASVAASEFVLLPAGDCHVAPRRDDLAPLRARALLEGYGFDEEEARSFVASFAGTIDFVPLHPGRTLQRYHSGNRIGRFLTDAVYWTQRAARRGLALPDKNLGETRQRVKVIAPTMALVGRIRDGMGGVTQFFVLRPSCLEYATAGYNLPEK